MLLDPVLCEELENVVAHEDAALEALHANLHVNVLGHVRDDAFLAVTELCRGLLRASLVSLSTRFFQA